MPFQTGGGSGSGSANTVEQTLNLNAYGQAGDSLTITAEAVLEVKKDVGSGTYVESKGTVNISYDVTDPDATVITVENLLNASTTYKVTVLS